VAKFLISPTEHELIKKLGDDAIISPLPEEKGADILIYSKNGIYGAQRKSVPHDFIASVQDGRLTRETSLMPNELKFYEIICEGKFRYFPNGHLAVDRKNPSRYTRKQITGIIFDIKFVKGINIEYTDDMDNTAQYLKWTYDRLNSSTHYGLLRRPSMNSVWYVPSKEETQSWLLQSWSGIGPSTAEAIIKKFGRAPLRWTCSLEELSSVSRLGKSKAKELIESLEGKVDASSLSSVLKSSISSKSSKSLESSASKQQEAKLILPKSFFDSIRAKLQKG
jgi:ERCC4-type nuclease